MTGRQWLSGNSSTYIDRIKATCRKVAPGAGVCLLILLASKYLADYTQIPVILIALLSGMVFRPLALNTEYRHGFEFCSSSLLRFGIGLLGARITITQIGELGWQPVALLTVVPATIVFSLIIARWVGLSRSQGLISGCAVAICGVAAVMAVVAVLPRKSQHDNTVLCSIVGVAGLSTAAMLLYPGLQWLLAWSPSSVGLFLGASIHDVANVVGAGYMISTEVGDTAVFMKMLRVAMLVPTVLILAFLVKGSSLEKPSYFSIPGFLLLFVVMAVANNTGYIPVKIQTLLETLSSALLVMAMAAVGARVELTSIWLVGKKNFILMALNTVFIASMALTIIALFHGSQ